MTGKEIHERLPIKLILPKQAAERRVHGGGQLPQPFCTVDAGYRQGLINQLSAVRNAIFPELSKTRAAPIRVQLRKAALAKSHRPEELFSDNTCPIVGGGRPGELFVKATPAGITSLAEAIQRGQSNLLLKEISCVETIEPITPTYRRLGLASEELLRKSPRRNEAFVTRVRLFSFGGDDDQTRLIKEFEGLCEKSGIPLSRSGYSDSSLVYAAQCRNVSDIESISGSVAVRSISNMPIFKTGRPSTPCGHPILGLTTRDMVAGDVPVVVVVDSGISTSVPELNSWVIGRTSEVAPQYRNEDHGTFVAGLICWGKILNPDISGIDDNPCALYDLQVMPNVDPDKGQIEFLHEQELLVALEKALKQHANDYKVWNLSLGTESVCSLDDFSPIAEELDNLQEKYGVSFVISAGNFNTPPLLDYPRKGAHLSAGRITVPADSILGITVGSISHVDLQVPGPKMNEPAPYSRHGAGPNYVIKPDLVHFGGTCTIDGATNHGIRSVGISGQAEDSGTSFAAPLVSRILAQIYHQVTPTPSPVLARALLTHHARDPRSGGRVPDGEENFFGFGLPSVVPHCLECTPYSATLVFEDALRPGYYLEWDHFPYPDSLTNNGKFFGDIRMTVAFSPARGARWGSEYCETHIDTHFGIYYDRTNRKSGEVKTVFRGLVPPEHKNPGILYESYQIEKLRKWAPVRTYFGALGPNGQRGNRWRLKVQLLTRHELQAEDEAMRPQPFSLIVTISDPHKRAPVYDEMARKIASKFQSQNLSLRAAARIRSSAQS